MGKVVHVLTAGIRGSVISSILCRNRRFMINFSTLSNTDSLFLSSYAF